ncbi:hypothetical protein EB061_04900 [bacterium]|jgi:hypothetical protein|nr:hypothetical protein [bacterium]
MDREDFIEQLRQQYADGIYEAYLECEHEGGAVDYPTLRNKIELIGRSAAVEGLPGKEFHELVSGLLPHDIVVALYPDEYSDRAA